MMRIYMTLEERRETTRREGKSDSWVKLTFTPCNQIVDNDTVILPEGNPSKIVLLLSPAVASKQFGHVSVGEVVCWQAHSVIGSDEASKALKVTAESLRTPGNAKDASCGCHVSTLLCGCTSRGKGKLNDYGLFEIPCTHDNAVTPAGDNTCSYHTIYKEGRT
jgi:hypothetical protein